MADGVVGNLKEGALEVPKNIIHRPLFTLAIVFTVLFLTLFIEAYKPGLLTGPIKRLLNAMKVPA